MVSASGVFLASFPSPDRGVWHLGPLPIRAYALCIIAGIIVAIWWGERRFVARGGQPGTVIDVAVFAVPFGLVGGRLYHVITDYDRYFGAGRHPVDALKIWDGGLGIWGAIALGGVGAWLGCRRRGVPLPAFADAVAPGIAVAQAIGRLGNYFNQELFGGDTTLPWGLEIYKRVNEQGLEDPLGGVAINHIPERIVHPTFLYELLWDVAVAVLVVWADRRFRLGHGRAFALYVAGYTAGRFWIELMRTDPAKHILGLRVNVWVSILVFIGAVAYLIYARRLGEREDLAALTAPEDADVDAAAVDAESDSDSEADSDPDSEADSDPDSEADSDVDAEADSGAGVEAETDAEADAVADADADVDADVEPANVPAGKPDADPTADPAPAAPKDTDTP